MGQWTTATVILDDRPADTTPTDLLTQIRVQPNSLVHSAVVERRNSPPKLYLKARGNQPGLRDTLLDYCAPVRDAVTGVYIASLNNTSDDAWLGYYEPDPDPAGERHFRLAEQATGTLDTVATGSGARTTHYTVVRPTGDGYETDNLLAYFRETYGAEPLISYA